MTDIFRQALAAHQSGNVAEAERLYRAAIAAPNDSVPSRQNLAMILMQKGAVHDAEPHIARAAQLAPNDPAVHQNHAVILTALSRNEEAAAAASRAIALQPNYALAYVYRAHALLQAGRAPEAITDYEKAVKLGRQGDPALFFGLGHAFQATGALEQALDAYSRTLKMKPDLLQAMLNRGNVLVQLGRFDEALADADRILARASMAEAHDLRGMALFGSRRNAEALEAFQAALALNPNNAAVWRSFGNLLNTACLYDRAMDAFDRAAALDKNLPFVRDMRLHCAMQLNDWRDFDTRCAELRADIARG
jgi:tetratricopeptide (TPR) repeat protein